MKDRYAELAKRQWWHSGMKANSSFWWRGRSVREMRESSRKAAAIKARDDHRRTLAMLAVLAETERLNQAKFGKPAAKPRLDAYRAKFAKLATAKPATPPKSKTPRLDAARAAFAKLENGLIRDGFLERIPEHDERGKLIGHRIKRAGDVKNFGRWVPTPEHDRRIRMRLLESGIERREDEERGGKIGVDVRWSPHAP